VARGGEAERERGPTVLVIEDNEPFRRALLRAFEPAGFHCVEAPSWDDGLRLLRSGGPFDLVLVDLLLPETAGGVAKRPLGLQLARKARELAAGARIVIITADEEAAAIAELEGFDVRDKRRLPEKALAAIATEGASRVRFDDASSGVRRSLGPMSRPVLVFDPTGARGHPWQQAIAEVLQGIVITAAGSTSAAREQLAGPEACAPFAVLVSGAMVAGPVEWLTELRRGLPLVDVAAVGEGFGEEERLRAVRHDIALIDTQPAKRLAFHVERFLVFALEHGPLLTAIRLHPRTSELPPLQQDILAASFTLSQEEIHERLRLPLGTVKGEMNKIADAAGAPLGALREELREHVWFKCPDLARSILLVRGAIKRGRAKSEVPLTRPRYS
jgi:CheY-like chemotaxis protein